MTPRSQNRRPSSLRRRRPYLDPRPRILVVCEGSTEQGYFRRFSRQERARLVEVVIADTSGVPKTLVETAVALKKGAEREARRADDDTLLFDEVWCVFDVDEHPMLEEAKNQARDNGIRLAVSNPCFELWVLLHFQEQTSHITRHAALHACCGHVARYAKTLTDAVFETLAAQYTRAIGRARALEHWQRTRSCDGSNPSTDVHYLTERIRDLGQAAQLKLFK